MGICQGVPISYNLGGGGGGGERLWGGGGNWTYKYQSQLMGFVCACLLWAFVKFCVCPFSPFGIEGWM